MSAETVRLISQTGGAAVRAANTVGNRKKIFIKLYPEHAELMNQLATITQKYYLVFKENIEGLRRDLLRDKILTEKSTGRKGLSLPYPSGFRDIDELIIAMKSFTGLHQKPMDANFLRRLEVFQTTLRTKAKNAIDIQKKLVSEIPTAPKTRLVMPQQPHVPSTLIEAPVTLPISVRPTGILKCPVCDMGLQYNHTWGKFKCPNCSTQIHTDGIVRCPNCESLVAPGPFKDVRVDSFPCSNVACSKILRHPRYGELPGKSPNPNPSEEESWVEVSGEEIPPVVKKVKKRGLLKKLFKIRGGGGVHSPYEYIQNKNGDRFAITSPEGRAILIQYTRALFGNTNELIGGSNDPEQKISSTNSETEDIYIRRNEVLASIINMKEV